MKTIHDDAYQILIDCLRTARQTASVTQVDLASDLGTDQSYVSKYERAERRLDVIEVRAICKALRISFPDFLISFEKELKKKGLS
ncbi:MAG: helix-turn-helix transcriptional regulator [Terriglobia bacterium]